MMLQPLARPMTKAEQGRMGDSVDSETDCCGSGGLPYGLCVTLIGRDVG